MNLHFCSYHNFFTINSFMHFKETNNFFFQVKCLINFIFVNKLIVYTAKIPSGILLYVTQAGRA